MTNAPGDGPSHVDTAPIAAKRAEQETRAPSAEVPRYGKHYKDNVGYCGVCYRRWPCEIADLAHALTTAERERDEARSDLAAVREALERCSRWLMGVPDPDGTWDVYTVWHASSRKDAVDARALLPPGPSEEEAT